MLCIMFFCDNGKQSLGSAMQLLLSVYIKSNEGLASYPGLMKGLQGTRLMQDALTKIAGYDTSTSLVVSHLLNMCSRT